jgi:hypothetical protein
MVPIPSHGDVHVHVDLRIQCFLQPILLTITFGVLFQKRALEKEAHAFLEWQSLVEGYSGRKMTLNNHKLPARFSILGPSTTQGCWNTISLPIILKRSRRQNPES